MFWSLFPEGRTILSILLIVVMVNLWTPSRSGALDFTADWRNWEFSDEDSIFTQSYSISVAPEATRTINFGGSFRYVNRKQGGETRQTLTPTLSMEIINDLFDFNLNGTQTQRKDTDRADVTNSSWDANLTSDCKGYADIRLYVGQTFDRDDSSPRRLDDDTFHYGFEISKKWKGLDVVYNYRGTDEKDRVEASKTNTDQNFFKAEYSGAWKKLTFSAGQQFNFNKTVIKTETKKGEAVRFPLIIGVIWDPPRPPNGQRLKRDQILTIDLRDQPVDEIRFYINGPLLEDVPSSVRWDLYESGDGVIWDELRTNITLPFRFRRTYQRRRYLRLVVVEVPIPAPELEDPFVQANLIRIGTGKTETVTVKSDNSRTTLSLGYQFTPDLSANYYFSYEKSSPDPGNETTNVNHTLSASWFVKPYLQPHANLSMSTKDTEGYGKDETTTISLNNTSQIFETLEVDAGYTHAFSKERGRKSSTLDTFNITTTANLYPDLDLRWNGNYSHTRHYLPNSTTKALGMQVYLTGRLTPDLTVSGTYDYSRSKSTHTKEGTITDQYFTIDATWRLSDDLSLRGSESLALAGDGEDTLNSTYSVWVALPPKVQLNLQYMNTSGDTSTDDYSAFVSWTISEYLTLKSTYDMSVNKDGSEWGWMVNLVVYF